MPVEFVFVFKAYHKIVLLCKIKKKASNIDILSVCYKEGKKKIFSGGNF